METKTCKYCGQKKPLNEFYKNRIGYTQVCKVCAHRKQKELKKKKVSYLSYASKWKRRSACFVGLSAKRTDEGAEAPWL